MKKVIGIVAMSLALAAFASAQELVTNGGFETGDFSGWTLWGDTSFTGVSNSSFNPPHSGTFSAHFGPTNEGGVQQQLTTGPGTYNVQFWYYGGGTGVTMRVEFGDAGQIFSSTSPPASWTLFQQNVTVGTANPLIKFAFTNAPSYWYLDDVSVTPEPASLLLLGLATLLRRR